MLRPQTTVVVFATAILSGACVPLGSPASPFSISPDSLFSRFRAVAVAPVECAGGLGISGDALAKLEAALETHLRRLGFSVVPTFEYVGIWQHLADEQGGFFDTYTGERDNAAFNAATARLKDELIDRFQTDALVYPELWDGLVPFEKGIAEWDGASQAVFGAYGMSGEVRALTLVLVVEDMNGRELFSNGFGFATIEAWHDFDWLPLVIDGVISDSRLISTAVTGVLEPLYRALPADSGRVQ